MDLINFSKFCWYFNLRDGIKFIAIVTFVCHLSPFIAFAFDVSCSYLTNDINDTHLLLWSLWLVPSFTGLLSGIFVIGAILLDTHQLYNIYLNLSFVTLFVSTTVIIGIVAIMGRNFRLLLAVPVIQFYFWCCSYSYYKTFNGGREPAAEIVL